MTSQLSNQSKLAPPGHRLGSDWIVRLEVTPETRQVWRLKMLVECSLAGELFVKHELARMLRIKVEFICQATGLLARGSNQRLQFASQLFFMAWRCLKVDIEDDRSFRHGFP